jgi:UV DNA damage endonuclease
MSVRLGYACLSVPMREKDIFCSRTLTLKSLEQKGIAEAKRLAKLNIADMIKIIEYNESVGLRFWRLTSNLFPHMENPRAAAKYNLDFAKKDLAAAGKLARQYGHRISMHPGQFAQLGSPRKEVVTQTFKDLTLHAKILEYMGLTPEMGSVLIIHGGGSFGDKQTTLARWEENFRNLPEHVRRYISLENDDYQYTVTDLLPMCERNGIPLCIDFFHHQCLGQDQFDIFDPALIRRVMNTWKLRGIKPKCHWSNQKPGARKGSHSDCVKDIPRAILKVCAENNCDIMLECKHKDLCTLEIYKKHFNRIVNNGRVEWYLK